MLLDYGGIASSFCTLWQACCCWLLLKRRALQDVWEMKAVKMYRVYGKVGQAYGVPDACLQCFSNCVTVWKRNTIKGVSGPLFGLLLVYECCVIDVERAPHYWAHWLI